MSAAEVTTLTARQARFVDEFLVDGCGTQAALRAGFAASGAHVEACRQLRNAKVAAAIKTRQEAVSERLGVTQQRVVEMLLESFQVAKQKAEPAAMVAAAREVGRLLGYYAPAQTKVTLDVAAEAEWGRLGALSDQELFGLIASLQSD
jgi:phage terminase small subunit